MDERTFEDRTAPQEHVRVEHYLHARSGRQSRGALALLHHRHLGEVCPACRTAVETLGEAERERVAAALAALPPRPDAPSQAPPVDAHLSAEGPEVRRAEQLDRRYRSLRRQATKHLWYLRRVPRDEREEFVRHSRSRFRTLAFAEVLLEASLAEVRTDPREAENLAALVPLALRLHPDGPDRPPHRALALRAEAHRANALRIAGDLPAADAAFRALRRRLAAGPPADLATVAEVASLEASLRLDQRRHAEAEERLTLALVLYRQAGDDAGWGKALVQRGMLLRAQGRLAEATETLRTALARLAPGETRLRLSAVNCALVCLCDLGRFEEAERELAAHLDLYELGDDPSAVPPLRELQGRIALGLGRFEEAIEQLAASRDGYLACGRAYDAAIAALDLACAHLEAGDRAGLRRLARELVPSFRNRGVSREALAALGLLARTAHEDRLTAAVAAEIRRRLEASRPTAG